MNTKLLPLVLCIAQTVSANSYGIQTAKNTAPQNAAEFMEHGVSTNIFALPVSDKCFTTLMSGVTSILTYAAVGVLAHKMDDSLNATLLQDGNFKDALRSYLQFNSTKQTLVNVALPAAFIAWWNFFAKGLYPENTKSYINNKLLNIVLKASDDKETALPQIDELYQMSAYKRAAAFEDLTNILEKFEHAKKILGSSQADNYAKELMAQNSLAIQKTIDHIRSESTWSTEYTQAMAQQAMNEIMGDNSDAAYGTISKISSSL